MVDQLPEFQGPKYRGSFRRGDFADRQTSFRWGRRASTPQMRGKIPPSAATLARNPTTGIADCCARATSGQAAAAPPISVMNLASPHGIPLGVRITPYQETFRRGDFADRQTSFRWGRRASTPQMRGKIPPAAREGLFGRLTASMLGLFGGVTSPIFTNDFRLCPADARENTRLLPVK